MWGSIHISISSFKIAAKKQELYQFGIDIFKLGTVKSIEPGCLYGMIVIVVCLELILWCGELIIHYGTVFNI